MKVALGQINATVADWPGNAEKILQFAGRAKSLGAELVLFPEQCLGGYPALDLWQDRDFWAASERWLKILSKKIGDCAAVVGFASQSERARGRPARNSAALLHRGKIIAIRHKTLIPTYDVFDEARYFEPAETNLPIAFQGTRLGLSICEDAWAQDPETGRLYDVDPLARQAKAGAQILLNISASPYQRGKLAARRTLLRAQARRLKKPLLYCNAVGGNDEILFDGASLAFDARGEITARAAFAEEDLTIVDTAARAPIKSAKDLLDVEQDGRMLALGISDFARKCGLKTAFIGLSGGIDSAVTACLAVRALGKERVVGVLMPSRYSSAGSIADANELARNLQINHRLVSIDAVYGELLRALGPDWGGGEPDISEQNLQSRARGTVLMALANKAERGFVLTTGNKSELAVGYCTLYGDMCGALAPLADAPKRLVYELARWINSEKSMIPKSTIEKAPSAELKSDQSDQDDLPPYDQIDDALEGWVNNRLSSQKIARAIGDKAAAKILLERMERSEFKRRQAPPGLRISSKAFGIGRRIPIAKKTI